MIDDVIKSIKATTKNIDGGDSLAENVGSPESIPRKTSL